MARLKRGEVPPIRRRRERGCLSDIPTARADARLRRRWPEGGRVDPTSRRIKEMEVMVADVIVETPDTTTLVLFTGNDRLEYLAGHFLTIDPHQFESLQRFTSFLEDLKGRREPPRAYSMSSAPHERYLAVTVKRGALRFNVTRTRRRSRRCSSAALRVCARVVGFRSVPSRRTSPRSHRPRVRGSGAF
jgi:hypothetical protein